MKFLNISFYRRFKLQLAVLGLVLVAPWAFPQLSVAAATNSSIKEQETPVSFMPFAGFEVVPAPVFPKAAVRPARYTIKVPVTAYSSTPDQTDDTPFITAAGTPVRWGVVAANFLPIGTHVRMPDYFGDQIFIVEDRMNPRYSLHLDIWMETRQAAKQWGLRQVNLEVL